MTKIIFLCHGNICRSPMAEFVMKDLVEKAGLSGQFEIASAATSTEEIGNPVYPPARRKLAEHGICCAGKTARQMTRRDYETYDYLIAMDRNNLRNMVRFVGSDPEHKVSLLMDHASRPGDVADPWYTGDFEATWQECVEGCLSFPNRFVKTIRPQKVTIQALNKSGEEIIVDGEDEMAKCFCHELEHHYHAFQEPCGEGEKVILQKEDIRYE